MATDTLQNEPAPAMPVDRDAWDNVLANYRDAAAVHKEVWDRFEAAEEAVDACTPERVDRYFEDYGLGIGMKRDDIEFWLRRYVTRTCEKLDVQAVADEFDAYQAETIAARERFQTDNLYQEGKAINPLFSAARDQLMRCPAPDQSSLLLKIEVASISLDDEHASHMLADARRLLAA